MPIRKPHPNAKKLRRTMPPAEQKLWAQIRRKQLGGYRFRRQHTIGHYIADFACVAVKLVIELDGAQHGFDDGARDARRDTFMEAKGWTVIRFWNDAVYTDIESVLETIFDACETARQAKEFSTATPDETPE